MNKFKKSQLLILSLLAALLFIAPLLSPSLRPTYLYFVINFLIIALGAEAGLLSLVSRPQADSRMNSSAATATVNPELPADCPPNKAKPVEKSTLEKIDLDFSFQQDKLKKCPSMPSLFYIGGHEVEPEAVFDEEEETGGVSGQELFAKAENFIGNFYKQLKMQREESWSRIHGFYQKAF